MLIKETECRSKIVNMETFKEEPVAKRLRSKIVYMKTSEEEPVAKRLRSTIVNMKTSKDEPVATRLRSKIANIKTSKGEPVTKCYVIEFTVSYREITNSRFSLNQSKPCISKFLGPTNVIKERLQ